MTGPEHYREAERLLELAQYPQRYITGMAEPTTEVLDEIKDQMGASTVVFSDPVEVHDLTLAAAQVHATLALAAATVLPQVTAGNMPGGAEHEWTQVIGHPVLRCADCRSLATTGIEGEPCEDCGTPLRIVSRWEL